MSPSRLTLPPLNALKAFHAAAKQGSIRRAADGLLVTPQAVSQQIKHLEDILGVQLFERRGRVVELTESGVLLARFVEAGFDELAEGVRRVTNQKYEDRINLNVSPYFATRYLLPRLELFLEAIPRNSLRMTTVSEVPDFSRDDIDVAIQWGYGEWGDLEATLLLKDHKIICCTPEIGADISSPNDLANKTLLHPVLQNTLWEDVFEHLGVETKEVPEEISLLDAATMRRATISGLGIGLISVIDAVVDIRVGDLVAPFGIDALQDLPEERVPGFYLVLPRAHRRIARIERFCHWVVSENWADGGSDELSPRVLSRKMSCTERVKKGVDVNQTGN